MQLGRYLMCLLVYFPAASAWHPDVMYSTVSWLAATPAFVCSTLLHDMLIVVSSIKCQMLCCYYEPFCLIFQSSVSHSFEWLFNSCVFITQMTWELSMHWFLCPGFLQQFLFLFLLLLLQLDIARGKCRITDYYILHTYSRLAFRNLKLIMLFSLHCRYLRNSKYFS